MFRALWCQCGAPSLASWLHSPARFLSSTATHARSAFVGRSKALDTKKSLPTASLLHQLRHMSRNAGRRVVKESEPSPYQRTVLLFSCDRTNFIRIMSLATMSQALFWGVAATVALDLKTEVRPGETMAEAEQASPLTRYGLTFACSIMSLTFLGLGLVLPRRFVTALKTVPNSGIVTVEVYSKFGLGKEQFQVAAKQMQFAGAGARSIYTHSTVAFSLPGRKFFYLLDGKNGQVHDSTRFSHLFSA